MNLLNDVEKIEIDIKDIDVKKYLTNNSKDILNAKKIFDGLKQEINSDNKLFNVYEKENIKNLLDNGFVDYENGPDVFYEDEPWIQTYSGRRFNPTNPIPEAIVIQDIAHGLSQIVRFCGQVNEFYSVAQHCVLVSYLCNHENALAGLLHDASEAYIADLSSPLKQSGLFNQYIKIEKNLMNAIYTRFGLSTDEPASVKKADKLLLATEARDFMSPLRNDWKYPFDPLPFKIIPLSPKEAEELFMKRFYELIGAPELGKLWKKNV